MLRPCSSADSHRSELYRVFEAAERRLKCCNEMLCWNITSLKVKVTHANGTWVRVWKYLMLNVLKDQNYKLRLLNIFSHLRCGLESWWLRFQSTELFTGKCFQWKAAVWDLNLEVKDSALDWRLSVLFHWFAFTKNKVHTFENRLHKFDQ